MIIKRFKTIMALCFLFSLPAVAMANVTPPSIPGWALFAADDNAKTVFYGKEGSLKFTPTGVSVLIQLVTKDPEDSVVYIVANMTKEACSNGYGTWTYHALSGGESKSIDYVKGGSSLGANVGDVLCYLMEHVKNKKA